MSLVIQYQLSNPGLHVDRRHAAQLEVNIIRLTTYSQSAVISFLLDAKPTNQFKNFATGQLRLPQGDQQ